MNATLVKRLTTACVLLLAASTPLLAARGRADFTRYVAIGDSYGAGVVNSSLVLTHQSLSYPAIIARQTGALDFQQPLVGEPGISPELRLWSLSPLTIAPVCPGFIPEIPLVPCSPPQVASDGMLINGDLPRQYNNVSVPGARVNDALTLTGKEPPTSTARYFGNFILRGLGTPVEQAIALNATFVTVWIGGNDVLGAILAGTPAALTPLASFTRDYNTLLDRLTTSLPNAGIVVGDFDADPTQIAFARAIPPFIVNPATGQPVLDPTGAPIYLFADLGGGVLGQLDAGGLVLLSASTFLQTGYGIPPALAPGFPQLPNAGKPLPDQVVLSSAEAVVIRTRAQEFNAVIRTAATSRDIPIATVGSVLTRAVDGINYGNIVIKNTFLTGGLFSYDGFHLTDLGYTLFANEFIKAINSGYGTKYKRASITPFFQNNQPPDYSESPFYLWEGMPVSFTIEAWESVLSVSGLDPAIARSVIETDAPPTAPPSRSRSIRRGP